MTGAPPGRVARAGAPGGAPAGARAGTSRRGRDEEGAVLLAVLMFGALASLVMLALAGRATQESRAVADSLAQTRAYWAAMGVNTYALSRTLQAGGCGGNCGNALVGVQQGYINEIQDMQLWRYPEVSGAYAIQMRPTASQDPVSGAQEMLIRTTFAAPPAATPSAPVVAAPSGPGGTGPIGPTGSLASVVPDALAQLGRLRPLEFRYCLVASAGTTSCNSGINKTPPTYQRITSVHRPAS